MAANETYPLVDCERTLADIGRRIRAHRKSQGLSSRKFASMIGVDRTVINDIEKGRGNPTAKTLIKIAAGLEVDPALLFIDESDLPNLGSRREYAVVSAAFGVRNTDK